MTVERIGRNHAGRKTAAASYGRQAEAALPGGHVVPETELTPRVRAAMASLAGEVEILRRDLQSARDRLEEAERIADQDHLLPILNRRAFLRELTRHIALTARYGTQASLAYFDLDGFKFVNDTHGHACGDAVLAHFADVLRANVRDTDVVGRLGGDEFGVILTHVSEAQTKRKAEALLDALTASPAQWNGERLVVGFSFGTFELTASENAESSIARADQAMYAQKRAVRR
jgi:diguanylate cyclase (GGDEF)-like protein